jgi:hypothetical protein
MDATATGIANPHPTIGESALSRNHNPTANAKPSTKTALPAIVAAMPPTRDGWPAIDTLGAASKKRAAPQAAQRESSP